MSQKKTCILRKPLVQMVIALVIVALDRVMKLWIVQSISGEVVGGTWMRTGENIPLLPGVIHLTHVHNFGAAFSILENMRWPLFAITVLLMGAIIWALFAGKVRHPVGMLSLGMVLGGAVGNAIDRALFGYVVDMFEVEFMNYAVFNVADIFIVCGAVLFCVYILFFEGKEAKEKQESFRVISREEAEEKHED